jgi:predicted lipoprotein with Yx(FWY)xxD motif
MPIRILISLAAALAVLGLAACGDDDDDEGDTTQAAAEAGASDEDEAMKEEEKEEGGDAMKEEEGDAMKEEGTEIVLRDSQFGSILFDGEDQAIYLFDKETSSKPDCYGACAEAWPPVVTEGDPVPGKGADADLLGTTKRDDGSTQVTYGGHPLYYYVDDGPGEVLCQGVDEFGGLWLVVDETGSAVPA